MSGYTRTLQSALTTTNLQSNASSATNMWCSASFTPSANCIGLNIYVKLTHAATSPANSKASFVHLLESADGTNFADPASGSEGDQTIADFTTNPLGSDTQIGVVSYRTSAETREEVIKVDRIPALECCIGIINHTGAAYSTGCEVRVEEIIAA